LELSLSDIEAAPGLFSQMPSLQPPCQHLDTDTQYELKGLSYIPVKNSTGKESKSPDFLEH